MGILTRQVEGKIYYDKFDNLSGWAEQEDLRNTWGFWSPWGENSYSELVSSPVFSSPAALDARIEPTDNGSGDLLSGKYLRRARDITIPAGVTSVRMQVQHRWYRTLSNMAIARKITLGSETFLNQQATDVQNIWVFKDATVATAAGTQTLKVGAESYATVHPLDSNVQHHYFDNLVIARGTTIAVSGLNSGYKGKLYDPSDTLIAEATESGGTATIDIEGESFPIVGKIVITTGADVVVFTSGMLTDIFGGDEYLYSSDIHTLSPSTDLYIINQKDAGAPEQAAITFTLKDSAGTPVPAKTITFTTSKGTLGAASDVTAGEEYGFATVGSQNYPSANFGETNDLGAGVDWSGYIFSLKVTLGVVATLKSISLRVESATNARVAIFVHNAGGNKPAALLAESGSEACSAGTWHVFNLAVHLAAGTYWLAIQQQTSVAAIPYVVAAGRISQKAQAYGAFPGTWPADSTQTDNRNISVYATYVQIKGYMKRGSKFTLDAEKEVYSVKFYSYVAVGNARVAIFDEASPKVKKWESGSVALTVGWNTILISSGTPTTLTLPAANYGVWWQYDNTGDAPSYTAGAAGDGRYLAQAYGAFPATIAGDTSTVEKWTETIIIGAGGAGEAHTTLESTSPGIAIVKGEWVGDASNPRCWSTIEISIHEAPDSPDSEKLYDVWVQGRQMTNIANVLLTSSSGEDLAKITLAEINEWIGGFYDFCVYRYGSAVFFGRIQVLQRKVTPEEETIFYGLNMVQSLMRIPIESAEYTAQTLEEIIEAIHATYVESTKQVPLGTISPYLQNMTITLAFTDVTAYDAFLTLARLGMVTLCVGADRALDFR